MSTARSPVVRPLLRSLRRAHAEVRFIAMALGNLSSRALAVLLVGAAGAAVMHESGGQVAWGDALYASYRLLMGELPDDWPQGTLPRILSYVQPLLGVLLVAEGVIKIGLTVFQKDQHAEAWVKIVADTSRGHVILCGLGSVGFRVLEELLSVGEQVIAVEKDGDNPFVSRARDLGVEVLLGDARADGRLRALNLAQARAVIIVTNDDLANMEIALDVREIRTDIPIVMRLYDQQLAQKVKGALGVQVSVSTSKLAAPLFASAALDLAVVGTHRVGDALLLVMEIELLPTGQFVGKTPQEMNVLHRLNVVARKPVAGAWDLSPRHDVPLQAGERIQVLTPPSRVDEVHQKNGR